MSKRSASQSSDREVMRYLSRSQIFKDYEGAFGEAMGLPLISDGAIRGRRRIMEKKIMIAHSPQFWLALTRLAPPVYRPKPVHLTRTRHGAPSPGLRDSPKVRCQCM